VTNVADERQTICLSLFALVFLFFLFQELCVIIRSPYIWA